MRSKTVFLHVGSEKTGSTALAKTLVRAADNLSLIGIFYPRIESTVTGRIEEDHRKLAFAVTDGDLATVSEYLSKIECQLSPEIEKVIISSELFFHVLQRNRGAGAGIELIREWAKRNGFAFEVIVYLRAQEEVLESLYNQRVKWDALSLSFGDWVQSQFKDFDYDAIVSDWESHCDRIHACIYDHETLGGEVTGHFLQLLGVPKLAADCAIGEQERIFESYGPRGPIERNQSLSPEAICAMLALLRSAPDLSSSISEAVFNYGNSSFYRQPFAKESYLDLEIREAIYARYRESNSRLATRLAIGQPDGMFLPPANIRDGRVPPQATGHGLFADLCIGLLRNNLFLRAAASELTPGVISPGFVECEVWFPSGWCKPEGWGAWSISNQAEILLKLPQNCDFVSITMDCAAFVPGDHVQTVTLSCDDTLLGELRFDAQQNDQMARFEFAVDPSIAVHRLRLYVPHARAPLNFGLSADHRDLGMALRSLSIQTRLRGTRDAVRRDLPKQPP